MFAPAIQRGVYVVAGQSRYARMLWPPAAGWEQRRLWLYGSMILLTFDPAAKNYIQCVAYNVHHNIFSLLPHFWLTKEKQRWKRLSYLKTKLMVATIEVSVTITYFTLCELTYMLKGQCHEIFCFRFFSWITFPQAPENNFRIISNFFKNSRRYSQVKVHHRCQRHRWQICRRCQWHRWQIAAGINDTGGKFATGISDTGGKFCHQFPLCSCSCQWHRWQIAAGINNTGGKFATGVNDTGGK